MNKQTLILLVLIVILFIPTGITFSGFAVDKYSLLSGEGGVAYALAYVEEEKPAPIPPTPQITTCDKCNGTKKYKPDGVIEQPCPCKENCKCSGMAKAEKPTKQIVVLTNPKFCVPCKQWDENVKPALKVKGWTFGKEGHILIVDSTELEDPNTPWADWNTSIPTFLLVENGKVVGKHVGFLSGYGVGKLWAGKDFDKNGNLKVEQNDTLLFPYTEPK